MNPGHKPIIYQILNSHRLNVINCKRKIKREKARQTAYRGAQGCPWGAEGVDETLKGADVRRNLKNPDASALVGSCCFPFDDDVDLPPLATTSRFQILEAHLFLNSLLSPNPRLVEFYWIEFDLMMRVMQAKPTRN